MGVVSGEVKVAISVTGTGNGAQVVQQASTAQDKLAASSKRVSSESAKASSATSTLAGKLKDALGPADGFRGAINALRENVSFFLPGIGALAAGILALASDFLTVEARLDDTTTAMFKTAGQAAGLTVEIARTADAASKAARSTSEFTSRIATLGAEAARLRGDLKLAEEYEKQARLAVSTGNIKAAEDQLGAADKAANTAQAALIKARKEQQELRTQVSILQENIAQTEKSSGLVNDRDRARLAALAIQLGTVSGQVTLAERAYTDASKAAAQYAHELVMLDDVLEAQATATPAAGPAAPRPTGGKPVQRAADDTAALRERERQMRELEKARADRLRSWREQRDEQQEMAGQRLRAGMFGDDAEAASKTRDIASSVRDISQVFAEAVPNIDAFAGALGRVAMEFDNVQAANDNALAVQQKFHEGLASSQQVEEAYAQAKRSTTVAVIGSVGAIARAGAEQIKNERLRAGVLSLIELGTGLALQFVPGRQAEAAGHFAAAAVLGSVAIFGGGSSSGSSSKATQRSASRPLGDTQSSGSVSLYFNAPYIATGTVQETVAELSSWIDRGASSGYAGAA